MSKEDPLNLTLSVAVAQNQLFLERFTIGIATLNRAVKLAKTPRDQQLARAAFGDAIVAFIKHLQDSSDVTVAERAKILVMLQVAVAAATENPRVLSVIAQQLGATRDNDDPQIIELRKSLSKTIES